MLCKSLQQGQHLEEQHINAHGFGNNVFNYHIWLEGSGVHILLEKLTQKVKGRKQNGTGKRQNKDKGKETETSAKERN